MPQTVRIFLSPYAAYFRSRGWHVAAAAKGASSDAALREGFDATFDLPLSRSILDVGALGRGVRAISRALASRPHIVHVHTPIAAFLTRLAIRRLPRGQRPLLAYTAHGFHFHRQGGRVANFLFLTAERLAGRWTDRLVVINDEDYASASRHRIVPDGRLVRMPGIGIDTQAFVPSPALRDRASLTELIPTLEEGRRYFICVAELSRRKRVADIVQALTLMKHQDATVVLVGEGSEQRHLDELVAAHHLQQRVIFTGQLRDVRRLIAGAVALVLASDREGLARAIMEALALEVPVIASKARGNEELVEDQRLIFDIGDVSALATRMDWCLDNPEEAAELGRSGRRRMVERYDQSILLKMHEDMYLDMLDRQQQSH